MENSDSDTRYKALIKEIADYRAHSFWRATLFGAFYYVLRVSLIILSASAAADRLDALQSHAALFSLLVAIGTSIDTWLKTGSTYRGHYVFNDKFAALMTDLELTDKNDSEALDKINDSFKKMVTDYGVAVLPS